MEPLQRKKSIIAASILMTACVFCRAESAAPSTVMMSSAAAKDVGRTAIELKEKFVAGTQHYRSNDAAVRLFFPYGFNINGEDSIYSSVLSSRTATFSVSAGKDWDEGFLDLAYSWSPLANNYRSHAVEISGAYYTPSDDLRTTIGATFNTTYNTELTYSTAPSHRPVVVTNLDVRQMTATFNLEQMIYDTKLTADFGKSSYDHEIARMSAAIRPTSTRLQGLAGLLQGFPDMEWKLGAYHDLSENLTAWLTYDHIRLLMAQQGGHGSIDSYMTGIDMSPASWIAVTLQYDYLTETAQFKSSQWGMSVRVKF